MRIILTKTKYITKAHCSLVLLVWKYINYDPLYIKNSSWEFYFVKYFTEFLTFAVPNVISYVWPIESVKPNFNLTD